MKKIIGILMVLFLICSFTACNKNNISSTPSEKNDNLVISSENEAQVTSEKISESSSNINTEAVEKERNESNSPSGKNNTNKPVENKPIAKPSDKKEETATTAENDEPSNKVNENISVAQTNYRVKNLTMSSFEGGYSVFVLDYIWSENSCKIVIDDGKNGGEVYFNFNVATDTLEISNSTDGPFARFTFDKEGYITTALFYNADSNKQNVSQTIKYTNAHKNFVWDTGTDKGTVNGSVSNNNIVFTQNEEAIMTIGYNNDFISNLDIVQIKVNKNSSGKLYGLSYLLGEEELADVDIEMSDDKITHSWEKMPLIFINWFFSSSSVSWASNSIAMCYVGN